MKEKPQNNNEKEIEGLRDELGKLLETSNMTYFVIAIRNDANKCLKGFVASNMEESSFNEGYYIIRKINELIN